MNALHKAVSIAGSQKALADQIGVVQSAVANWLKRGNIPVEHCLAIEKATGGKVTRQELRPEDAHRIWPDLVEPGAKQAVVVQATSALVTTDPVLAADMAHLEQEGLLKLPRIARPIPRPPGTWDGVEQRSEVRRADDRARDAKLAAFEAAEAGQGT